MKAIIPTAALFIVSLLLIPLQDQTRLHFTSRSG